MSDWKWWECLVWGSSWSLLPRSIQTIQEFQHCLPAGASFAVRNLTEFEFISLLSGYLFFFLQLVLMWPAAGCRLLRLTGFTWSETAPDGRKSSLGFICLFFLIPSFCFNFVTKLEPLSQDLLPPLKGYRSLYYNSTLVGEYNQPVVPANKDNSPSEQWWKEAPFHS